MIILDTNSLLVLTLGLVDPNIVNSHERTSIYSKEDFDFLLDQIKDFKRLVIFPNVWTELDNLMKKYPLISRNKYVETLKVLTKETTEEFVRSVEGFEMYSFYKLGLTDSNILYYSTNFKCEYVITSDSNLSDHLIAHGVNVIDLVKIKNSKYSK
jgi:rRNA-processing protein FCF1